ncbi:unnamed protein product, partial [Adineta steineri]
MEPFSHINSPISSLRLSVASTPILSPV